MRTGVAEADAAAVDIDVDIDGKKDDGCGGLGLGDAVTDMLGPIMPVLLGTIVIDGVGGVSSALGNAVSPHNVIHQ